MSLHGPYSTYEREIMAIVLVVCKWPPLLALHHLLDQDYNFSSNGARARGAQHLEDLPEHNTI